MSQSNHSSHNSFGALQSLRVGNGEVDIFNPRALIDHNIAVDKLPYSLRVLLEYLLRNEDGNSITREHILAFNTWLEKGEHDQAVPFGPARVLLQDFTGVPAVVDLAAMRDRLVELGQDPANVNPLTAVDLVIDHSVMVDSFASMRSFAVNVDREFTRNKERYSLLRWAQQSFRNFRVVPPGTGICHQVNIEYLAKVIWVDRDKGRPIAFPDSVFGADSHTTMVNALGVLGWGVGGIEAEAAMLGQASSMIIPKVVGMRFHGKINPGITATDIVLSVTEKLRSHGVVGKFVEFSGEGLQQLSLANRATIANMAPEYGATCGFFPIDNETLKYLSLTGRPQDHLDLVETYAKHTGFWSNDTDDIRYTDTIDFDLSDVVACMAGPKRPQDRIPLPNVGKVFRDSFAIRGEKIGAHADMRATQGSEVMSENFHLCNGDVVIAAITSCTNTSNPSVMIAAGLLARHARKLGLTRKPWVKTSLAPGSQVVTGYLQDSHLQADLDALGFNLVGYGCTTCIGNSGPIAQPIVDAIAKDDLSVAAVLSGNRNFEARINPHVRGNFLASPPLVVAYAIAGTIDIDITRDVLAYSPSGDPIHLKDIWPDDDEIAHYVNKYVHQSLFKTRYADVFAGQEEWQKLDVEQSHTFNWDAGSTYVRKPPFFGEQDSALVDIHGARVLICLGNSTTTDHISPAGGFRADTPAGKYLVNHKINTTDFNSYGARRGNHEVMMRGTFANSKIKNMMVNDKEGGLTRHQPSGDEMSVFDAAMRYQKENIPLVVFGGKEYGTGSSRDWAAKGPLLLGVKAVIVESFERIHRSNLIGMGILPLEFVDTTLDALELTGKETFDIVGISDNIKPGAEVSLIIHNENGEKRTVSLVSRIDTDLEIDYVKEGGILPYVLHNLIPQNTTGAHHR